MIMRPMVHKNFMAWSPAKLAQAPSVTSPVVKVPVFDEPLVTLGISLTAAFASALLAYKKGSLGDQSSTIWWVISGMAFIKALHDSAGIK